MHNANPSDLYLYALPLGIALPQTVNSSCSTCTKSVMAAYASGGGNLTALQQVYNGAAAVANKQCGNGYVQITKANGAAAAAGGREVRARVGVVGLGLSALLLLW